VIINTRARVECSGLGVGLNRILRTRAMSIHTHLEKTLELGLSTHSSAVTRSNPKRSGPSA
jgi:hypothetical protein